MINMNEAWHILSKQHYSNVIMSSTASQITGVSIVCSIVCSEADQRKHQSSASLAFVRGIHLPPVNSHHKGPVTRKIFPLMTSSWLRKFTIRGWINVWIIWQGSKVEQFHWLVIPCINIFEMKLKKICQQHDIMYTWCPRSFHLVVCVSIH